jgi:signal transduction histidine kinase
MVSAIASSCPGVISKGEIKSFRMKLTIYFVVLSSIVYVSMAICAVLFFSGVQTKSLDDRLYMLASEVGHAIDIDVVTTGGGGSKKSVAKPRFRDWQRRVTTEPARGMASAELFDSKGTMLESFGVDAVPKFFKLFGESVENGIRYRFTYTPLKYNNELIGYVQVNVSTVSRDTGVETLVGTLCLMGPIVLLLLGLISYYVSGIAAEPLLNNVALMRRFIEDAGHELNTPLAIVRAKSEALEHRLAQAGTPAPETEATLRSLSRMERIVSDLMYLTELDTELDSGHFETIDVAVLLGQLGEDFAARFAEKGVEFKIENDLKASVRGEPDSLYRALSNLTENALRYTDKGQVIVAGLADHDHVKITVTDTGIGIPAESLGKLFERFYRVDKSRSRASGGVGLGLSIVKTIVERHKGTLAVNSLVDSGTVFTVTLPVV